MYDSVLEENVPKFTSLRIRALSVASVERGAGVAIAGSFAKPYPHVLFGLVSRVRALVFRYEAICDGVWLGKRCFTSAARPATCGEAWLVPYQEPQVLDAPPSAPTMSGLVLLSVVGPRLLELSIVLVAL